MSKLHWAALATTPHIGGKTITRLLGHFGSLEAALQATPEQLLQVRSVGPRIAQAIYDIDLEAVRRDLEHLEQEGGHILTWDDAAYPTLLLRTAEAPPVLFVRGQPPQQDTQTVAVVGTRQPASRSLEIAHELTVNLAQRGWTIVSGLALGIDTAAHTGALEAEGRTVAVLGSGVLEVYPQRNNQLAEEIIANGAILSEQHPLSTVSPQTLIARNRITSGLSKAVIVVQSEDDSGSIATARRARQQGRRVYAVTGSQAGGNSLVEQGASPINPERIDWDALTQELQQHPITDKRQAKNSQPRVL